jgi:hypothetical protein
MAWEDAYPEWMDGYLVEVRRVGPGTFEARTVDGAYSAVGGSVKEAVELLRTRTPHPGLIPEVRVLPSPKPDIGVPDPD